MSSQSCQDTVDQSTRSYLIQIAEFVLFFILFIRFCIHMVRQTAEQRNSQRVRRESSIQVSIDDSSYQGRICKNCLRHLGESKITRRGHTNL